ncbi:YsnF/AvaK domain-containing protein [Roseomonas chloroacetimidivorans]|uniref:YsnF/AvaK domain-containing protein n=1 Tax=Roseomonas chloroacetimidivorans TaxID=1766656 RepID=UPI003C72CFB7
MRVGKRTTKGGRVRARSYMVETPVKESVSLRDERVDVAQRSVDRRLTDADRTFEDHTIEAAKNAEEAVVSKEPRAKEEMVIRTDAAERVETINDTVRRQVVEIENAHKAGAASKLPGVATWHLTQQV